MNFLQILILKIYTIDKGSLIYIKQNFDSFKVNLKYQLRSIAAYKNKFYAISGKFP